MSAQPPPSAAGKTTITVAIEPLRPDEVRLAAAVLARGMRDNPLHVAALGSPPQRRQRVLAALFRAVLPLLPGAPLAARQAGTIVGVLGMTPPGYGGAGHGWPRPRHLLRALVPTARLFLTLLADPRATARVASWFVAWAQRDLPEPHWHLGPVAVEPRLQGRGIGSQLLTAFCAQMDALGAVAYLETDKAENVTFYRKFGFGTMAEASILSTPNWFMRRGPTAPRST